MLRFPSRGTPARAPAFASASPLGLPSTTPIPPGQRTTCLAHLDVNALAFR